MKCFLACEKYFVRTQCITVQKSIFFQIENYKMESMDVNLRHPHKPYLFNNLLKVRGGVKKNLIVADMSVTFWPAPTPVR